MRRNFGLLVVLTAFLSIPTTVSGQICHGGPALGSATGNVGGGASFFDGGKQYSGGVTIGSDFFGSGSFSFTDFDDSTLSLKRLSGGVGYEVRNPDSQVSFCPSFGLGYGFGLEISGIDITTLSVIPAVAAGLETAISPTVSIVPFAQAALIWQRVSADAGPLGDDSESETNGALGLGVALMFNQVFSIGPAVNIPIGTDDGDTSFGIGLAVAFGGSD